MQVLRLARQQDIQLSSGGDGYAFFGPAKSRTTWNIKRFTTIGNSAVEPNLNVYRGAIGTQLIDTTKRGNQDVSETDVQLVSGEFITVLYKGGTPNAVMTFYLEGDLRA